MHLYKKLQEKINYLDPDKIEVVCQAYQLALESHEGQKRDNGDRFITHPLEVACILADMRIDYQSIVVGLLHDVVEDTQITKKDINNKFGAAIADLVDGVTKLTEIEATDKGDKQAQNFRKMVLAMSRDIRVILIKLADRLHNMRTIDNVVSEKRQRIAKETLDIYAPIANRLGMYKMCIELENLCFAALYPRRCRVLKDAIERVYGEHRDIMKLIEQELSSAFIRSSLKGIKITGRTKHLYGIYKKMVRQKLSFVNVMDVYAFRVIVNDVDDCYRALGVIHGLYKPLPGKIKDYIAIPKFNGYQALHTVLFGPYGAPVEVQICSQVMDQMANNGVAAHWLYKTGSEVIDAIHVRAQQWVNNVLEMQKNTSNSSEFFENLKIDLFPDKVYVFTPKGNIMELTRGSTVIDFAYAVHTDVGNTCVAAKINRRYLPLSTVLMNGQTVSIITSRGASPNPEWLNFVITSKARHGIRQYLKNRKRDELIALGKQLLGKAIADLAVDKEKANSGTIDSFAKKSGFKSRDDLYEDIGRGNHLAILVACNLANIDDKRETVGAKNKPLLIRGAEGMAITFASCCCPIPGDPIVGYLNSDRGLDVHTEDCLNLEKLRNEQPGKYLSVNWAEDISDEFCVTLSVELENKIGALAELTRAILKANSNIEYINTGDRSEEYSFFTILIMVKNLSHFERVKRYVSGVSSVVGVMRKKDITVDTHNCYVKRAKGKVADKLHAD